MGIRATPQTHTPYRPREAWADHARGLGIALVVYGHVVRGMMNAGIVSEVGIWQILDRVLYAFHMPLFFFLSGLYFLPSLRRNGRLGLLLSKVDTILYPYLIWTLLYGSIKLLMSGPANASGIGFGEVLTFWIPLDHFWFLFGLFFVFLVSMIPMPVARRDLLPSLVIVSLVLFATSGHLPLPWQQVYVVPFAIYFTFGAVYAAYTPKRSDRSVTLGCFGLGLVLLMASVLRGGVGDLLVNAEPSVTSIHALLMALAGILLTCGLARVSMLLKLPLVTLLGSASLLIYVSHTLFAAGARILLQRVLGIEDPAVHLGAGLLVGLGLPTIALQVMGARRLSPLLRASGPLQSSRLLSVRPAPAAPPRVAAPALPAKATSADAAGAPNTA